MADFCMPSLGAEMTEGRLVEWLVRPGDTVHRGDVIAVVETDKATLEVEVWQDGVVDELLVEEGLRVPVGTPLARLRDGQAAPSPEPAPTAVAVPARAPSPEPAPTAVAVPARAPSPEPPPPPGRRPPASPYARRLAAERGVDTGALAGTGPGGAVVARDVVAEPVVSAPGVPESAAPAPAEAMRGAIARAMARSKREIPHYYLGTHVDVTTTLAWLDARNADRPAEARVLPAVLQLKAVALALREHRELNGFWQDDGFVASPTIDLGAAIALRGGGLVAPAILETDTLDLDELMSRLRDLVRRARVGRLRVSEATAATLTVTNLGDLGVETVYGVIYPPQVAIVGFGRPAERPWAVHGLLGVRTVVHLTLAADHRQTDGHLGARFLATVTELLHRPEEL